MIVVLSYKVESGDLGPVDVTVLLLLLLPLLLHRHCPDHLLLSVFILLLFLLPDNIKEQHGVLERVPRLFGFGRQWLLDQNLDALHAHIGIVRSPLLSIFFLLLLQNLAPQRLNHLLGTRHSLGTDSLSKYLL